jgi:hypothetical protein
MCRTRLLGIEAGKSHTLSNTSARSLAGRAQRKDPRLFHVHITGFSPLLEILLGVDETSHRATSAPSDGYAREPIEPFLVQRP